MRRAHSTFNRPSITNPQAVKNPFALNTGVNQTFSHRTQTDPTFEENGTSMETRGHDPRDPAGFTNLDKTYKGSVYSAPWPNNAGTVMLSSQAQGLQPKIGPAAAAAAGGGSTAGVAGATKTKNIPTQGNTGKAATFAGKALGAGVSYINKNRDIGFQAQTANLYFNTIQGGQGVWHGMHHHANQEAMARARVGDRMNLATDLGSSVGGPVGGLIGFFVGNGMKDKWLKQEMSKIDYNNAWSTTGNRMDSRYAPTSTYRPPASADSAMRQAKPGESVSRSPSMVSKAGQSMETSVSNELPTLNKQLTPTPQRVANARMTVRADVHNEDDSSWSSFPSDATATSMASTTRGKYEVNQPDYDSIHGYESSIASSPPANSERSSAVSSNSGSYAMNPEIASTTTPELQHFKNPIQE